MKNTIILHILQQKVEKAAYFTIFTIFYKMLYFMLEKAILV